MAINIYGDPLLGGNSYMNTPEVLKVQQEYMAKLDALKSQQQQVQQQQQGSQTPIWDKIDEEIATLTDMQKQTLFESQEFVESSNNVQMFLQELFLEMMRPRVENTEHGKELLQKQYDVVKKLKKTVIETTNKEMEQFRRWQEYASKNPTATYQDFLNLNK